MEDRLKLNDPPNADDVSELRKNENKFKLADPGFAKFVKKSPKEPRDVPKQRLDGGTETYGTCNPTQPLNNEGTD